MKSILCLAHDPGGYDVVSPVYEALCQQGYTVRFACAGPASKLNPTYAVDKDEVLSLISFMVTQGELELLLTGTSWGDDTEIKAIQLCKEVGIPTVSLLDYWSNYAVRFRDATGSFVYPDYYLLMDEQAYEEAKRAGVPEECLHIVGHPGLDRIVAMGQKSKLRQGCINKKLLFLSQPLSLLYGERLGYTEWNVVADLVQFCNEHNAYELAIRFHPKDDAEFQQQYASYAVGGTLYDNIMESELVVGMSTMGLLHTVLFGVPAVSYQPGLCEIDSCITNKLGLTSLYTSYEQLERYLKRYVEKGEAWLEPITNPLWMDGKSTERVVTLLQERIIQ